jgi:chemotaxis protein methyltransferase CheR
MRDEDARDFADLARTLTGIALDPGRVEFLCGRLGRRLTATGAADYGVYRRLLHADPAERVAFAEALTTHTTAFFREAAQYDWLRDKGFASVVDPSRARPVTIWSAACSTGQEGYSALMAAMQAQDGGMHGIDARLIGTDLSSKVLRVAAQAIYPLDDVGAIPDALRPRVLLSSRNGDGRHRIVPELRRRTTWRRANLASGAGLDGIEADVAFLRNVLIYFDDDVRRRVLDQVVRRIRPGGILLVGHTEAAHARRPDLEIVRPSILRKRMP